jgi:hypothetical protein
MDKIQTLSSLPEAEIKVSILYLREFGVEILLADRNIFVNPHKYNVTSSDTGTLLKRKQEVPEKERMYDAYFPLYCDVHALGNVARVGNRCYGNG